MKHWKAILGITLVFLLGVAAGSLGTIQVTQHRFRENPGSFIHEQIFRRMAWQLDLNETQRRQLRRIMMETQSQLREARQQVDPQMRDILRRMDDKVRAILLEPQRERYDELVRNRRRMLEKIDPGSGFERTRQPLMVDDPSQTNRPSRTFRRPKPGSHVPDPSE